MPFHVVTKVIEGRQRPRLSWPQAVKRCINGKDLTIAIKPTWSLLLKKEKKKVYFVFDCVGALHCGPVSNSFKLLWSKGSS